MIERFRERLATTMLLCTIGPLAEAQSTEQAAQTSVVTSSGATHASRLPLPFRGGPLVTGLNMWGGSALSVRTASHNEPFDGAAFRMVGLQLSRSLFTVRRFEFSWLVEFLPAIVATVGAPDNRRPTATRDPQSFNDPNKLARYELRDVYGVGLAPFGAEVSRPLSRRVNAMFNVTAGGAFFSQVVPYGKATQANFTVAPALGVEYRLTDRYALSSGYALHHLSNASFGGANPGLNSHLLFVRVAASRFGTRSN